MMNIIKLIAARQKDPHGAKIPTIAFLGDSVTHGCFELQPSDTGDYEAVFDMSAAYHRELIRLLGVLYPAASINTVNAGVSGDRAPAGLARLERDVLAFHPDLCVVCFGLNDCHKGLDEIPTYTGALREIFRRLRAEGIEVIFMTPNRMNTRVSKLITQPSLIAIAEKSAHLQNDGVLEAYLQAADCVAREEGVTVCDAHAKWNALADCGVDTDVLLSNRINHPTKPMQKLFAQALLETMLL